MEASSSSGLLKRAKTPSSIAHVTSCLVDGCDSDLSLGREYHRRHKVCELHSKTPKVTIRGLEQRFCQQCSRFHSLQEFDEGKRSCRKRLDGHNRRRRKPQSESQSQNMGTGGFHPNQQGSSFLSFSDPQLLPPDFTWPADQCFNYVVRHESFPGQAVYNYGEGNQFKIMHGNEPEVSDSSLCQPLLDANNSECALSLLSPTRAETQESALSRMAPYSTIHFCDPSQSSQGMESKPPVSALSSFVGYNANLHFQGMSQNLPDDGPSSATGSHQTLSFIWE